MQGGTIGNLSALVVARAEARKKFADATRWVIACSEESHSSIASAANVMDVDVLKIATRSDRKIHGEDVAREIDALHAAGTSRVFAVVGTAGTTNLGIIDDLHGIADAAHIRNIWFHVDGAYGLAALTTRSLSWTGSRQVTFASPSSVSLSKSVKVQHTTGTKTTQLTAGGKLVETSQPVDLKPYMDWVLPGASTGVPSLFDRRLQPVANDFGAILRQDAHAMDLSTFSKNQQLWAGSVIVVDGQSVVEIVPDGQADDVLTSGSEGLRRNALKGSSVKKG